MGEHVSHRKTLPKSAIEAFLTDRLRRRRPEAGIRKVEITVHVAATELGANWIPSSFDAAECRRPKDCQRDLMTIAKALAQECDAFPD